MALYDVLKDAASVAQATQNTELYQKLLDAQRQSLELQEENRKLKEEVKQLKDTRELEELMDRNRKGALIFLEHGVYCGICWGREQKRIPVITDASHMTDNYGDVVCEGITRYKCVVCKLDVPVE